MDFASRAEFAAHLTEHQHTNLWTCTQCGHAEEKKYLVRDHINSKHVTGDNGNRNVDIIQKPILRDLSSQSCPFCGEAPGAAKFVGHLCHHLEEISLSAIPRDAGIDEDDERGSSSGSSLPRGRIEEIFPRFDELFDEIDMASKATRWFPRDEDSPSTPFPLATASQKFEHELGEQSKNRMEDVDFQFEKEDPSQAQALKDVLSEPQVLESTQHMSSYWTVPEQSDFPALLRHFGTDWQGIANHMTTKSHIMVKNYYVRRVDSGKQRDWEQIAKEADRKRERGETTAPLPSPTVRPKRRFNTTTLDASNFQQGQDPSSLLSLSRGSSPKAIVPGPPQEEQAPISHGNSIVARDYGPTMDGVVSQEPASIGRRSLRPRRNHRPSRYSDSGLGSSVGSTSGKRAGETAFTSPIVAGSAITRSAAAHFSTIDSPPELSTRASNRIHEHILKPLLAKRSLKDFHPIVKDCPRRIHGKEIVCLRDLEKTLIFMAPVSKLR
jgi:hypothetical protein